MIATEGPFGSRGHPFAIHICWVRERSELVVPRICMANGRITSVAFAFCVRRLRANKGFEMVVVVVAARTGLKIRWVMH